MRVLSVNVGKPSSGRSCRHSSGRVHVDGLVPTAVHAEVGLPVALEVERAHADAALDRLLVDPGRNRRALPGDLARLRDLTSLCKLMAERRLDGQIEFEGSWRNTSEALDALLEQRIGGKACSTSTERDAGIPVSGPASDDRGTCVSRAM